MNSKLTDEEFIIWCIKNDKLKITPSKMNGLRKSANFIRKNEKAELKNENESDEKLKVSFSLYFDPL